MKMEELIKLDLEDFLEYLFKVVDFEKWEQECLRNQAVSFEQDEEFIKIFSALGEEITVLEVLGEDEFDLLETCF